MKLRSLLTFASACVLAACGGGGGGGGTTQPPSGNTQTLSTIRLGTTTASLAAGATTGLSPTALDSKGAAISGVTGYAYTSSNPAVVEIGSGGTLLGLSAGTSTVTVSLTRDGVTATATATITVTGALPVAASVAAGTDNTFAPGTVVVAKNATVTFAFATVTHNVTFRGTAGAPTNIGNTSSASVARAFPTAGDFSYDCSLHAGMTGTVVVR